MLLGKIDKRDIILLTDVKSNLDARAIDNFVENTLGRFFNFSPEYRKAEVIGVVAGMRIGGGTENYAESKGLWILGPSEDLVRFINKKGFKPKIWRYEH